MVFPSQLNTSVPGSGKCHLAAQLGLVPCISATPLPRWSPASRERATIGEEEWQKYKEQDPVERPDGTCRCQELMYSTGWEIPSDRPTGTLSLDIFLTASSMVV